MENKGVYTISMTTKTHDRGIRKAEELGLSFSAYISLLINKDSRE